MLWTETVKIQGRSEIRRLVFMGEDATELSLVRLPFCQICHVMGRQGMSRSRCYDDPYSFAGLHSASACAEDDLHFDVQRHSPAPCSKLMSDL